MEHLEQQQIGRLGAERSDNLGRLPKLRPFRLSIVLLEGIWTEFALDSPLEESGFEPLVPLTPKEGLNKGLAQDDGLAIIVHRLQ